jgi:hypothetical protein
MQIPKRLAPTISGLALMAGTFFGVTMATQVTAHAASVAPASVVTTCGCGGCHRHCWHHHRHHCCRHWHSCGCGWGGWGGWSSWNSNWSSVNVNVNDNSWDDDD